MQRRERQSLDERARLVMVLFGFPRKAADHIRTQTEDRLRADDTLDGGFIRPRRIPVTAHSLEHAIGTRLERRMEVRCQSGTVSHELEKTVVDFSCLERRQSKSNKRHALDQGLDEERE